MVMFHSLTIHRAFSNVTPDTLRLSCDFRYQPLREKSVVWNSLRPHMQLHSWEEIYKTWQHDAHQYYWMQYELLVGSEVPPERVPPTV